MDTPQEVEVWFILPAIRRQLAMQLKKTGMRQKDIAKSLNLTEAAVSQYLKKKRGEEIVFDDATLDTISKSAKNIADGKVARGELQLIMGSIKRSRFICGVCHDQLDTADTCKICYM